MRFSVLYIVFLFLLSVTACAGHPPSNPGNDIESKETWWLAEDFAEFAPSRVAVLPMENLSLEPGVEKALYDSVYDRLTAKGYIKIAVAEVRSVMHELGVQVAGQLAGISPRRLGEVLRCDAVMKGRVDQSGAIHAGVYDALVVSISLQLVDCKTGRALWSTEQWRAAHRQWAADPINLLLNFAGHETGSREKRVAWLVQKMLKTLPDGPVQTVEDNLLDKAAPVESSDH
jgi:TolB-like protein